MLKDVWQEAGAAWLFYGLVFGAVAIRLLIGAAQDARKAVRKWFGR